MTAGRPEREITCSAGHPFMTPAATGAHGISCKHRLPDGTRCKKKGNVPAAPRPGAPETAAPVPAAAPADPAASGGVPPELPPAARSWRESLGEEIPDAPRCDDCGCDSPPIRYTGDRTGTLCPAPECGPRCWDPSPDACARGTAHAATVAGNAVRSGKASAKVPQSTLDAHGREARRLRDQLLTRVRRVLADPRITADTQSNFAWFLEELSPARLTIERVDQLGEQIQECPVERRGDRKSVV